MTHSVLVTGGAGFIGQNLVHHLLREKYDSRIVVLDALTYAANLTSLNALIKAGAIVFERGDISDLPLLNRLFDEYGFDRVAHLAAESHVDRSIVGSDAFIQSNIVGTHNLLKCALANWRKRGVLDSARFLHVSTDEVFGDLEDDEPAFTEASPYRPSSPYSASKASSDHLARAFCRTYGLPIVITNCSNNYGPYQHPEKMIPLMIINSLKGQCLPIYGDGLNIRDWLFVEDHCRALKLVMERGEVGGSYNIGGGAQHTNKSVVHALCDVIDVRFREDVRLASRFARCPAARGGSCGELISYVEDRPGHDRRYAIDGEFIMQTLGFSPAQTFESGLKLTVDWYVDNEDWWHCVPASAIVPNLPVT